MEASELGGYEVHEACSLLPSLPDEELAGMVEDIRRHGQQQPIVLFEGKVLDGRHRLRACLAAGVPPKVVEWQGPDPVRWVLSLNFHRRQLTEGQKAIVAARAEAMLEAQAQARMLAEAAAAAAASGVEAPLEVSGADETPPLPRAERRKVRQDTAALVRVSTRAVARGRALMDTAVPELVTAVERGRVPMRAAEEVAQLEQPAQRELVTRGEEAVVAEARRMREAARPVRPTVAKALVAVEERFSAFKLELVDGRYQFEGLPGDGGERVTASAVALRDVLAEALDQLDPGGEG